METLRKTGRGIRRVLTGAVSLAILLCIWGCPDAAVVLSQLKDAQAGAVEHTVTYDGNGAATGSVPHDYGHYVRGDTVTVAGNTGGLAWYGRAYAGWNTRADCSGTAYSEGQTFAMGTSDVTLYAVWTILPTFTVTYDPNEAVTGSAPTDPTIYLAGEWVTVRGNSGNLAKPPLGFDGWSTQADGGGSLHTEGQTFRMGASNVTLYAAWVTAFRVTYDANGADSGTVPEDTTYYPPGHSVKALGNTGGLTKASLAWGGWNTKADGTGATYATGSVFAIGSSDLTLYAKWVPFCTLTYDGNGATSGTVPSGPTVYAQGETVTVLGNTGQLEKDYYWTPGWKTSPGSSGHLYQSGDTFIILSDTTLYAYWLHW
jgi:hypothetical protein